jgi:hypothetical protein
MKSIFFILLATLFTNCKNKKSNDNVDQVKTVTLQSSVKLVLDMIVPKDDIFQLFYTLDGTANFNEQMSIRLIVDGSNLSQKLIFELPEDLKITRLRIDVGENSEQDQMQINSFYIKNFDKIFELTGNEFFRYFGASEEITIDPTNSTFTAKLIREPYDPVFYQKDDLLTEEIEKIQNSGL